MVISRSTIPWMRSFQVWGATWGRIRAVSTR